MFTFITFVLLFKYSHRIYNIILSKIMSSFLFPLLEKYLTITYFTVLHLDTELLTEPAYYKLRLWIGKIHDQSLTTSPSTSSSAVI